MRNLKFLSIILIISFLNLGAAPNRPVSYTPNTIISSSDVNNDINTIYTYLQNGVDTYSTGSITNTAVNGSAAIASSKLNLSTISQAISMSANFTLNDTYLMDLSGINGSATTEGLKLPQNTDCSSSTAEGLICWDTNNDTLYLGTGSAANGISTTVLIQSLNSQTGAVATGTTAMNADDTIPQITEGDQYMTLAITPTNASNLLKIDVVVFMAGSAGRILQAALFQDTTADALASSLEYVAGNNEVGNIKFTHYMTAGTTSSTTFRVRAGNNGGATTTFNGSAGGRLHGGTMASSITIQEIKL